jgi:hypothetical protein|eukprot:SAG25_NODE_1373_length_3177_cov_2.176088_4_plen_50_part_00
MAAEEGLREAAAAEESLESELRSSLEQRLEQQRSRLLRDHEQALGAPTA